MPLESALAHSYPHPVRGPSGGHRPCGHRHRPGIAHQGPAGRDRRGQLRGGHGVFQHRECQGRCQRAEDPLRARGRPVQARGYRASGRDDRHARQAAGLHQPVRLGQCACTAIQQGARPREDPGRGRNPGRGSHAHPRQPVDLPCERGRPRADPPHPAAPVHAGHPQGVGRPSGQPHGQERPGPLRRSGCAAQARGRRPCARAAGRGAARGHGQTAAGKRRAGLCDGAGAQQRRGAGARRACSLRPYAGLWHVLRAGRGHHREDAPGIGDWRGGWRRCCPMPLPTRPA